MKAHTSQEFDLFMSQLMITNATLDIYTDFEKCSANVRKIALRLNQLNYLIGKTDLSQAVRDVWAENPNAFSVLDILIAIRDGETKLVNDPQSNAHTIASYFQSPERVMEFICQTGLEQVFRSKQITNLVDYVFGVEVGLDTHTRKNRSGKVMEKTVAEIFENAGIQFRREVRSKAYPQISAALGKDTKRFDFAIETKSKTYLIEANFYSGGGSKLNEVARAYTELAPKINNCQGFEFVWITDGIGWKSAASKLQEAFKTIPSIYNLSTIQNFINTINS